MTRSFRRFRGSSNSNAAVFYVQDVVFLIQGSCKNTPPSRLRASSTAEFFALAVIHSSSFLLVFFSRGAPRLIHASDRLHNVDKSSIHSDDSVGIYFPDTTRRVCRNYSSSTWLKIRIMRWVCHTVPACTFPRTRLWDVAKADQTGLVIYFIMCMGTRFQAG